ncbi:hypothetical protein E6C27_scaffold768G00220 [Cucumis melo var. makuwa]|uniref:Uncharacterized protein n=1 Tax=Cucumis melo var. makuwa TaxID=1194695 RepID=A0A5A7TDI0_CUCMM|nr:hypothetical protein E6C27_scaffold768G00220 [Cucumis melo var. makuwa]
MNLRTVCQNRRRSQLRRVAALAAGFQPFVPCKSKTRAVQSIGQPSETLHRSRLKSPELRRSVSASPPHPEASPSGRALSLPSPEPKDATRAPSLPPPEPEDVTRASASPPSPEADPSRTPFASSHTRVRLLWSLAARRASRARLVEPRASCREPRPCLGCVRADPSLQVEPVPASLAEPTCLSLSRQSAPVPLHLFWARVLQPRPRDLAAWKAHFLAVRTRRANLQPIRVVPAWVSFGITTYLGLRGPTGRTWVLPRDTEDQIFIPTGAHVARVRERARDWVGAEVGAKTSWQATRSDRD